MTELWLIIAVAVGTLFVISVALLTTKKKQAFQDDAFLTLGGTLLILGIIFGDDRLVGYSFIGLSVLLSIISTVRGSRKK
jgi:hypothetical protein